MYVNVIKKLHEIYLFKDTVWVEFCWVIKLH